MELQKLLSYTRKAVEEYHMIQEGDKIAVGISGGKDSLTLLMALKALSRFYPEHFTIEAITVHLGHPDLDFARVQAFCEALDVHYTIVPTEIYQVVFDIRKETNPCSLCAKMRKGALNDAIKELGCNKIAYAHHKDDLIETMMMSLIFEGRFHSFSPVTYLDKTQLTLIRPLMFVPESEIVSFTKKQGLPVVVNPCPADGYTKRQYAKELIAALDKETPGAKEHMFSAILNGKLSGWPERELHPRMNRKKQ